MKLGKEEYRYFNGEEFFSEGIIFPTREKAKEHVMWWKRLIKERYPDFPFKYRIIKVNGGYKAFTNNTVRNMADY